MGHYAAECDQNDEPPNDYTNEETFQNYPNDQNSEMSEVLDYMNDDDPEMDQIPGPIMQPQINLAQIGAQMDTHQ